MINDHLSPMGDSVITFEEVVTLFKDVGVKESALFNKWIANPKPSGPYGQSALKGLCNKFKTNNSGIVKWVQGKQGDNTSATVSESVTGVTNVDTPPVPSGG